MKFTVKRAEMLKAVKTALKAVGGLEEISVTKDLLIEANSGNGIVSVTGTDLQTRIQCRVKALNIAEDGGVVLKPLLSNMLRLSDGDVVEFSTASLQNNTVNIRCGNICYDVPFIDANEYPKADMPFPQDMICVQGINSLINRTAFAAGTNISEAGHKVLEFVKIKFNGSGATAEATNGIYIAISDAAHCSDGQLELLIHQKAIKMLSEIISADETLYIGTAGHFAVFMRQDMIFHTMLSNEQFVDTGRAINGLSPRYQATCDAKALYNLISNVTTILGDKDDKCVNLAIEEGKVTAYCITAKGCAKDSVEAIGKTPTPADGFNFEPRLILDCLHRMSRPIEIFFNAKGYLLIAGNQSRYLVGPRKPAVITVPEPKEKKPKAEKKSKKTVAKAA